MFKSKSTSNLQNHIPYECVNSKVSKTCQTSIDAKSKRLFNLTKTPSRYFNTATVFDNIDGTIEGFKRNLQAQPTNQEYWINILNNLSQKTNGPCAQLTKIIGYFEKLDESTDGEIAAETNYKNAASFYSQAAELLYKEAKSKELSEVTPKDYDSIFKKYRQAAYLGSKNARNRLIKHFIDEDKNSRTDDSGVIETLSNKVKNIPNQNLDLESLKSIAFCLLDYIRELLEIDRSIKNVISLVEELFNSLIIYTTNNLSEVEKQLSEEALNDIVTNRITKLLFDFSV